MKGILSGLLAVLLFQFSFSHAQTILPRAGIAISTTAPADLDPGEARHGQTFTFGVGAEFDLSEKFNILLECNYLVREYRFYVDKHMDRGRSTYDVNFRHQYIDFPVLLKWYFGKAPLKFYVASGPYAGYGLGGTKQGAYTLQTPTGGDYIEPVDGEILYEQHFPFPDLNNAYYENRMDFGFVASCGFVILKSAIIDIRYGLGLVNIDEDNEGFKNRTLQISVAVPLKLTRFD